MIQKSNISSINSENRDSDDLFDGNSRLETLNCLFDWSNSITFYFFVPF